MIRAGASGYRATLIRRTRFAVVVGSYGKTTTARALSLALTGRIHRHLQNNSGAWPALAVLRTPPGARYAVAEVGISGPGQMAPHARVMRPDIVVVTSIGTEHHSSLGTLENTRAEKAVMIEALDRDGLAVLNGDDPNVMWMRDRTSARIVTFGQSPQSDVRVVDSRLDWPHGTRLTVMCGEDRVELRTRLLGSHTQSAVVAALAVAWAEGLPLPEAAQRLEALEPMPFRLQLVPLDSGAHLIRDEIKSSYETMEVALDVLAQIPANRRICVFGNISEPPGSQGPVYRELGAKIAETTDLAVLVVEKANLQRYAAGATRAGMARESILHVDRDVGEAIRLLHRILEPGDVVLVKGRDTERLHRISLGLMGRKIGCEVKFCQLKLVDCDFCTHLAAGWGDRERVP
jgi:UDP-N-acetylmuramoyl-tripeptide--D-alanyl-D-alanine ligase